MAGLNVDIDIGSKLTALAGAWTEFTDAQFARAVQFSLTGVGIDAVNKWRRVAPSVMDRPTKFTVDAVRYEVDKALLNSIQTVDQASARIFVRDQASPYMKYGFGYQHRAPGDVGIEGWFADQGQIYLPSAQGLAKAEGMHPYANGNYSGRQVNEIAAKLAAGYQRNTAITTKGSASWGVFEINRGQPDPAHLGVGIHARPPRTVEMQARVRQRQRADRTRFAETVDSKGRKTSKKDRRNWVNRYSLLGQTRTEFTAAGGRQVNVTKVVNQDTPRLLFVTKQEGVEYRPVLTPSWQEVMDQAAETLADLMANELADKMEHLTRKALGGR